MGRRVTFVPHGERLRATEQEVVEHWQRHCKRIPTRYAIGTAQHESDFTINEVDTKVSGYVSKGIFQLSDAEAEEVGCHQADLLDLEEATIVFMLLCERRLDWLLDAIGDAAPPPPAPPPRDIWAYLALAVTSHAR